MVELSNLRIPLRDAGHTPDEQRAALRRAVSRACRLPEDALGEVELRRRAIDARKRNAVQLVYTVRVTLAGRDEAEKALVERLSKDSHAPNARIPDEVPYQFPSHAALSLGSRPVVVGAGCAGLFCGLALASAGLEPLVVERGDDATRRTDVVAAFDAGADLDPESNIQFGLGGAGTFSDGKLATGTKSRAHRLVLETFVEAGADPSILWDAHPHVGSDVLPSVVERIRARIEALGGEVRCRCLMSDLELVAGRVTGVVLESRDPGTGAVCEERVRTGCVVLACGHSARNVFELLQRRGVDLERKTFAMGLRIEHLQADVDRSLYGPAAGDPLLGAAPYKLVAHLPSGRSAFSFCMCPGGYVVAAASEPDGVVTNGMSLAARSGTNANSGLLSNVEPADLPGSDPLAGIALQRSYERAAYDAGGGGYVAPAQLVGDFLQGAPSSGTGRIIPSYPRGVRWGSVEGCLPDHVTEALRAAIPAMERRLQGFSVADAVLTGVESRSSSPVRVTRGEDLQAIATPGLWPCGEGAGYAGGIMSAAADGLRAAEAILASLG